MSLPSKNDDVSDEPVGAPQTVAKDGVATPSELQADIETALRQRRKDYNEPTVVVEALMYSLRGHGIAALQEPDTHRRLSALDREQVIGVAVRLMKLKPEIAPTR
jgi:hypothetical protein